MKELKELLCEFAQYAPHCICRSPLGTLWDLRFEEGAGCYLMEAADSQVDKALIVAACFMEAQQRGWMMGLSNSERSGYFCRIEMSDESEVSASSPIAAVACLQCLIGAFEEQTAQIQDFAEWG